MKKPLFVFIAMLLVVSPLLALGSTLRASAQGENPPTPTLFTEAELADDITVIMDDPPEGIPQGDYWITLGPAGYSYQGHPVFTLGWPVSCGVDNPSCYVWKIDAHCVEPELAAPVKGDIYLWEGSLKLTYQGSGAKQSLKYLQVIQRPAHVIVRAEAGCGKSLGLTVSIRQGGNWVEVYFSGQRYGKVEANLDVKPGTEVLAEVMYSDYTGDYRQVTVQSDTLIAFTGKYGICLPLISRSLPPPLASCPTDWLQKARTATDEKWGVFSKTGFKLGSEALPMIVVNGAKITVSNRQGTQSDNVVRALPNGHSELCHVDGTHCANLGNQPSYDLYGGTDLIGTQKYYLYSFFIAPNGDTCKGWVYMKDPPQQVQQWMAEAPSQEVADAILAAYLEPYYKGESESNCIAAAQAVATSYK
jgi:hypothetical protein